MYNRKTFAVASCVCCAALLFPGPAAGQELPDFAKVHIGMPLAEFVQTRPEARAVSGGLFGASRAVKLDKPDQDLRETNISKDLGKLMGVLRGDSRAGLFFVGKYTFKEGKLSLCQLIWTGNAATIAAKRGEFIGQCIARFGGDFRREVARGKDEVTQGAEAPYLAWEREDEVTTLVSVPPRKVSVSKEGQAALALVMSVRGGETQRPADDISEEKKARIYAEHGFPEPVAQEGEKQAPRGGGKKKGL